MTGRVIHVTEKMNDIQKENKFQIRNSTVDFLVFTKDSREEGIEVRVQDGDVWLTQKAIGQLFDVDRSVVTKHLKNIFPVASWMNMQYVQNLHILRRMERDINTNSMLCPQS